MAVASASTRSTPGNNDPDNPSCPDWPDGTSQVNSGPPPAPAVREPVGSEVSLAPVSVGGGDSLKIDGDDL